MLIQEKTPIAKSLIVFAITDYLDLLAMAPDGKELVTIFGTGDETHNWEALMVFIGHLPANTLASRGHIHQLFHQRVQRRLSLMRIPGLQWECDWSEPPQIPLSPMACRVLVQGTLFLSELEIARHKARWIGQHRKRWKLDHLNTWDRECAYQACMECLASVEFDGRSSLSWLLPVVSNRFYHQCLLPWVKSVGVPLSVNTTCEHSTVRRKGTGVDRE